MSSVNESTLDEKFKRDEQGESDTARCFYLFYYICFRTDLFDLGNETPPPNPPPRQRSPSPKPPDNRKGQQSSPLSPSENSVRHRRNTRTTCGSRPLKPFMPSPIIVCKNSDQKENSPAFILCDVQQDSCRIGRIFDDQIDILERKSIISPGYSAVLHTGTAAVDVQLKKLLTLIDYKTGERTQEHPRFELSQSRQAICMEPIERFPELSQFSLRDDGRTVAVGKVLQIIE